MNTAFQPPPPPTSDFFNVIQEWVAVAATFANILVIVGYISKKELREANLFIILLAAGDMLQGLGFAIDGFHHGGQGPPPGGPPGPGQGPPGPGQGPPGPGQGPPGSGQGSPGPGQGPPGPGQGPPSSGNFSMQDCTLSIGWITIAKIGIQLQTLATVSIAMERFFAVETPIWYKSRFTLKHRYVTIVVLLLLACLSLSIAILGNCHNSLNNWYGLFHESFIIFFQLFVLVICLYVMVRAKQKSASVVTMSREFRKVISILAVSAFSVVLVAFPHSLFLATSYLNINVNNSSFLMSLTSKAPLLMCLNSLLNFFIYFTLSVGFRRQWAKLLCCDKHLAKIKARRNTTTAMIRTNRVNIINVRTRSLA